VTLSLSEVLVEHGLRQPSNPSAPPHWLWCLKTIAARQAGRPGCAERRSGHMRLLSSAVHVQVSPSLALAHFLVLAGSGNRFGV
jgi:hypothetical protein